MFNWRVKLDPSVLHMEQVEKEALLRILADLLEYRLDSPSRGNLLILGQRWQGRASKVAECVMKEGAGQYNHEGQVCSTKDAVVMATRQGMSLLGSSRGAVADTYFSIWPKSGIYPDTGLSTLLLNCDHGRFVASCFADFHADQHEAETSVLIATALTLRNLRPQDRKLKVSCEELLSTDQLASAAQLRIWVDQQFDYSQNAELTAWREWRDKRDKIAESPPFFCGADVA